MTRSKDASTKDASTKDADTKGRNAKDGGIPFLEDDVENQIRESFKKQGFLIHAGAKLGEILPGTAEIFLPFNSNVDQQHGFFHGGVIATIADSASGYAAYTLIANGAGVLTSEFKINFIAPAIGDQLISRGRVIKPGRTLIVCQSDVFADQSGTETLVATALLTMMRIPASKNREK